MDVRALKFVEVGMMSPETTAFVTAKGMGRVTP